MEPYDAEVEWALTHSIEPAEHIAAMTRQPARIRTAYIHEPITVRNFHWIAVDASTYCGHGDPIGLGQTEDEAIADLVSQLGIPV